MENSNKDTQTLEGWAKYEKFQLLQALSEYGCSDIEQIQNFLSYKSKEEIEAAMNFYNQKALQNPVVVSKSAKRIANSSLLPIGSWAKLLTDTRTFEELKTEIATALRLIAQFEDAPPPMCTDKIDFKNVYAFLANALEGKSLPDNKFYKAVLEKCLVDIAFASKTFMKAYTLKAVIDNIKPTDAAMKINAQIANSNELTNIRYLSSQRRYNPFNIAEEYLKPYNSEDM